MKERQLKNLSDSVQFLSLDRESSDSNDTSICNFHLAGFESCNGPLSTVCFPFLPYLPYVGRKCAIDMEEGWAQVFAGEQGQRLPVPHQNSFYPLWWQTELFLNTWSLGLHFQNTHGLEMWLSSLQQNVNRGEVRPFWVEPLLHWA